MKRQRNRLSVRRTRPRLGPGLEMLECRRMFSVSYMEQDQVFAFEELSGPEASAHFGSVVAVDGDTMVVGAQSKDLPGKPDAGAVFVYTRNDNGTPLDSSDDVWQPQAQLIASNAAADDRFGTSVAISGDTIVVGSNYDDHEDDLFLLTRYDAGSAYVFTRSGGSWSQQAKLTASDAEDDDRFGNSVSIYGDTIVVGSSGDDHAGGSASGSAYVFTRTGGNWDQTAKLSASDAAAVDQFGASVAISGETIVVGSRWDDYDPGPSLAPLNNAGAAYVFTRSGGSWTEQAKLAAADPAEGAIFGGDVSISADTIVVGSVGDGHAGFSSGSAYVFSRFGNSWSQQAKLTATDAAAFDSFGASVSVSGDVIVVGRSASVSDSGSACIFTRNGDIWHELVELTASDVATHDAFGGSVSISGDTIVVGSRWDDVVQNGNSLSDAGSAYVFSEEGAVWSERDHLIAFSAPRLPPEADASFGQTVAVDGDTMVVGSPRADLPGKYNAGAAFVYTRNYGGTPFNTGDDYWQPEAKLTASDAAAFDEFGASVSISGNSIVVGSHWDDHAGESAAGSAYVFTRSGRSWSQQAKLTAFDATADDRFGSSVSISGDSIVVGSPYDDNHGRSHDDVGRTIVDAGSAYVFTRRGGSWSEQAKLIASDAVRNHFGNSVSISGESIVVGSSVEMDWHTLGDFGGAYVFNRSGGVWSEQVKLTDFDMLPGDVFGYLHPISVSLSGDTIVVGSHTERRGAGSAYVFIRTSGGWTRQAKLTASDEADNDGFGNSVSLSGDAIVVGSMRDNNTGGAGAGSAYVFTRSGSSWSQQEHLIASDAGANHYFGASVSISGVTVAVGSPGDVIHDGQNYDNAGSAYVFEARVPQAPVPGDVSGDGILDDTDVNRLAAAIVDGGNPPEFDLTGDNMVDDSDLDAWLMLAGSQNLSSGLPYLRGDANLDGKIDATDLNDVALNWHSDAIGWSRGDFNADGRVDATDLNRLALNWLDDVSDREADAAFDEADALFGRLM
jgi:hypothetical protein